MAIRVRGDFGRGAAGGRNRWPLPEPLSVVEAGFHRTAGFRFRVALLGAIAAAVFAVLGLRLWSLQLIQSARYEHRAVEQTLRVVRLPTPRGAIVDRSGRLLVDVQARLAVALDLEALGGLDEEGGWVPSRRGRVVIIRLARAARVSPALLIRRARTSRAGEPWAPAIVLPRVSRALHFYLEERRSSFPGVEVRSLPERRYPYGAFGGEFLGLLGEISRQQLRARRHHGYESGDVIGQSGLEATYDRLLGGRTAEQAVSVDAFGRPVGRPVAVRRPRPARALQLTIDLRLQRAAERAIRDGLRFAHEAGHADAAAGAAVVLDPRDGSIFALASYPRFDQARAARDRRYLRSLLDPRNSARPLLDRATQGLFPPGSTFKPVVAEAALASNLITPNTVLACTGSLRVGNHVFHNVEPGIFAQLTLHDALAISCDTWFYRLGVLFYQRQRRTGRTELQDWARRLGLGHPTGIDIPGEAGGIIATPAWLRRTFTKPWQRIWYEGNSVNLSIGQGLIAVTPLQLAVAYAALANGGRIVRPHLARAVLDRSRHVVERLRFPPRARLRLRDVNAIRAALYAAAHAAGGTSAAVFRAFPVPVAGKTGTAQAPPGSDHSWYASWAPAWKPRVLVVVLIEHGGFGAEAAAPAAREIYSAFFRADEATNRVRRPGSMCPCSLAR
jgi:penicillin-binding protein 2